MAFAEKARAFTRTNIEALNLDQIGCYGLYNSTEWVFAALISARRKPIK